MMEKELGSKKVDSEDALKTLEGNADVCEKKGVAKQAIHKYLKIKDLQIDRWGGAIHKYMKTKEEGVIGG